MRTVSQAWIDNQNSRIRNRGLLRIDFFSSQVNNNRLELTGYDADPLLSDMNNIRSIFPYDVADKNGYVSSYNSDSEGLVPSAYAPQIVAGFDSPVNLDGITIIWSENQGYAVDFKVTSPDEGEVANITGNTQNKVFIPVTTLENPEYPTFEIEVTKWSEPNAPVRIERVLGGFYLSYRENKIIGFNEQKVISVLGLELPQYKITFKLENLDRFFDPLYQNSYAKYLSKNMEIRTYFGYNLTTGEEWIKGGTYYLAEWRAPANSYEANFIAKDILSLGNDLILNAGDNTYGNSDLMLQTLLLDDKSLRFMQNPYDPNTAKPLSVYQYKGWNYIKNKAMPLLVPSMLVDEQSGEYQVYSSVGLVINYNLYTGVFTVNSSTFTADTLIDTVAFEFNVAAGEEFTFSTDFISQEGNVDTFLAILDGESGVNVADSGHISGLRSSSNQVISFQFYNNQTYSEFKFRIQLERNYKKTDYHIPIEEIIIHPFISSMTTREALQLMAHSMNCFIWLDEDSDIYFIRNRYIENENAEIPANIMYKKPEFEKMDPVSKISTYIYSHSETGELSEVYRAPSFNTAGNALFRFDSPYINGSARLEDNIGGVTISFQVNDNFLYSIIGVSGEGATLVIEKYPVISTKQTKSVNINNSGDTIVLDNPLIVRSDSANQVLYRASSEVLSPISVELELRIDPAFNVGDLIAFPFFLNGMSVIGMVRVDEIELNYNGAYRGKVKGRYILSENLILGAKTYVLKSGEVYADEETLLWHLQSL